MKKKVVGIVIISLMLVGCGSKSTPTQPAQPTQKQASKQIEQPEVEQPEQLETMREPETLREGTDLEEEWSEILAETIEEAELAPITNERTLRLIERIKEGEGYSEWEQIQLPGQPVVEGIDIIEFDGEYVYEVYTNGEVVQGTKIDPNTLERDYMASIYIDDPHLTNPECN